MKEIDQIAPRPLLPERVVDVLAQSAGIYTTSPQLYDFAQKVKDEVLARADPVEVRRLHDEIETHKKQIEEYVWVLRRLTVFVGYNWTADCTPTGFEQKIKVGIQDQRNSAEPNS